MPYLFHFKGPIQATRRRINFLAGPIKKGWDISEAYYEGKSFYVGDQDGSPIGIAFKPDGTKLYMHGDVNEKIYQYSLSTPWDISTAQYDNKSFSRESQTTDAHSLFFHPQGTKFYIADEKNKRVLQYSLSTPWDISTAQYDNKSFSVTAEAQDCRGIYFKPDGTKLYVTSKTDEKIFQYSLSTPWDISTAQYDNKSFYEPAYYAGPLGIVLSEDGATLLLIGQTPDEIRQYSLSTPWDISTAQYENKSFSVESQETYPQNFCFSQDGSKFYVTGNATDKIYQYAC